MMNKDQQYQLKIGPGSWTVLTIDPEGWNQLEEELKRSETYEGIFRFISTKLTFHFLEGAGGTELEAEYSSKGLKAEAEIKILQLNPNTNSYDTIAAQGKLNFQKRLRNDASISLEYIDGSVTEKFNARNKLEIPMNRTTDIDGNPYTGTENSRSVTMIPITIYIRGEGDDGEFLNQGLINCPPRFPDFIRLATLPYIDGTNILQETPNFNYNIEQSELGQFYTNNDSVDHEIVYNFNIQANITYDISTTAAGAQFNSYIYLRKESGEILEEIFYEEVNASPSLPITLQYSNVFEGSTTVLQGDGLILEHIVDGRNPLGSGIVFRCDISLIKSQMKINQVTAPLTDFNIYDGYNIKDILSKNLRLTTNTLLKNSGIFYNEYDGHFISSGFQIRNYPEATLKIKFDDFFKSLKSVYSCGLWYDKENNIWEVDDLTTFYKNTQTLELTESVSKWESEPREDIFSKILSGYEEEGDYEEIQGVYEFNLKSNHNMSILVNKEKEIFSKLNTDSVGIQLAFNNRYVNTGSTDTKYDNKNYITATSYVFFLNLAIPGSSYNIEGVEGMENYVNVLLTPRNNLIRNSGRIRGLIDKVSTDNIDFISNIKDIDIQYEDINGNTVNETDPITQSEMRDRLYGLNQHTFEAFVSDEDWNTIKANPHGYITYEFDGSTYNDFILEAKRNAYKKICKFVTIEK